MRTLNRRASLAVLAGLAAVAAVGWTIAGAQTDDTPRGSDPLTEAEVDAALAQAQGSGQAESGGLGADDVVLLVERHEEDKAVEGDRRRADVYVYSYDDDVLTQQLVDLETGRVVQTWRMTGRQLPLIEDEVVRTLEIATADPELSAALATAYRQAAGEDLTAPETQLDIQALVFRADQNPAIAGTRDCGVHRCAQLLIQTTDGLLVNLFPVVDLSTGRVVSVRGGAS